jgi:hypothetical protein
MKTGLAGSLGRMSSRERNLVLSLVALLAVLILGGGVWYVSSSLSDKEEKIERNWKTWASIKKKAPEYLAVRQNKKQVQERLKSNPDALSPDSPVAQVAVRSKVRYRTGGSDKDESAMMNKILHTTGDLIQRPLIVKRRKQLGPQVYRVEKEFNMKRGFARVDDVWTFLGSVEALDNLVFITKLHMIRWSRNPDYAQIRRMTASTLRYEESEKKDN